MAQVQARQQQRINPRFLKPTPTSARWSKNQLDALAQLIGDTPVVIVPGLNNSDENHWQSLWQAVLPNTSRVHVEDWHVADLDKWRAATLTHLKQLKKPALLISHSFGALASASIAYDFPSQVAGALLVAPADPNKFGIDSRLPDSALPVTSHFIASDSDPWLSEAAAERLASRWQTGYHLTRGLGHINSASHIGLWQDGLAQLEQFAHKVRLNSSAQ